MFLAAASYFTKRFSSDEWILAHFQPSIVSVANFTNLSTMVIFGNLQLKASYPKRIISALVINIVMCTLLALSTTFFLSVSAGVYLGFVLTMVFCTSVATGLSQNGAFALSSGLGKPAYTQAIMTGQALAGVLPSVAQIVLVLALSPGPDDGISEGGSMGPPSGPPAVHPPQESSSAAMMFFLTSTALSALSLLAFLLFGQKHHRLTEYRMVESLENMGESEQTQRKVVGLLTLYKKLRWLCASVFSCFAVTMFFPVFTTQITSNTPVGRLFQPDVFIPLAFFFWNIGDLLGRLATLLPSLLIHRPKVLFVIALCRISFVPLYLLCNIGGRGAVVPSDAFYLIIVQLGFGLTNGWLGSSCMMGAGEWVEEGEREATGGFMGLNLVAGLTVGSLLSFAAA